jgi:energy-coupling factor transporter ATP-binding protein EcfA2
MAAIKIQDLSYYYPETIKPALNRINLEIPEGQLLIIIGDSGSGKSTLLRVISGLIPAFYNGKLLGRVFLDGEDTVQMSRQEMVQKVGIVFQNPESQLVMNNVEQEIVFGLENLGLPNNLMKRRLMEMSTSLGLSGDLSQGVSQLSGGQKQKVALAGVMAMQPRILLLDEPTSQLDPVAAEEILNIIRRLNEDNGITVVMIEQRLERCCHLADRILLMENGLIAADINTGGRGRMWLQRAPLTYLPPLPNLFAPAGF